MKFSLNLLHVGAGMDGWSWAYEVEAVEAEIAELEAEAQGLREYLAGLEFVTEL